MFEFGGSLQEILVILVIALLVVGPKRLPEVGRMLARALRELRSASAEFRSTLETHLETLPPAQPHQGVMSASIAAEPVASPTMQSPTAEPADDDLPTSYFAQRGGRLFHRRDCRWASRISRNDSVGFPGAADAEREGFVACPACAQDRELTVYSTNTA